MVARGSIVAALPSKDRAVLLTIKSGFAFSFGFVNVITFLLTMRFNTLMTGNTLALALETQDWMGEEMLFTASLIVTYVAGGAAYDAFSMGLKGRDRLLNVLFVATIVLLGVAADVIQYLTRACAVFEVGGPGCTGRYLYFLTPLAFITGLVTSYLTYHPDGIITNLITNHMKMPPKALIKYALTGKKVLLQKGQASAIIATVYFIGSLAGTYASGPIIESYHWGHFTPVFTLWGSVMATLCSLHYTLCEKFCFNYELEQQMVEEIRATMLSERLTARNSNADDVRKKMLEAMSSRRLSQAVGGDIQDPLLPSS